MTKTDTYKYKEVKPGDKESKEGGGSKEGKASLVPREAGPQPHGPSGPWP